MPRDNDKHNDSRGRRDRAPGGKGRSGVPRGPDKKFAKRGFAAKAEGERSYAKKPFPAPANPTQAIARGTSAAPRLSRRAASARR